MEKEQTKKKPKKTLRSGNISLTVWENEGKEGKSNYNTYNIERNYTTTTEGQKEPEWKKTNSLRTQDLPKVMALVNKIYTEEVVKEQK